MLIDQNSMILASQNKEILFKNINEYSSDISELLISNKNLTSININGVKYYIVFKTFRNTNGKLLP